MGYKLADGSDSDLYRVGDTFQVVSLRHFKFDAGSVVSLTEDDKSDSPYFEGPISIMWNKLTPTEETKRKVAERFAVNIKSDYPDWLLSEVKDRINKAAASVFRKEENKNAEPEPLARIIDWRGGEKVEIFDLVIGNFENYSRRALIVSHDNSDVTKLESCRGAIDLHQCDGIVIRINTAAIPKQRNMTKSEVEREFGVKVVD